MTSPPTTSTREWYIRIALGISGVVIALPGVIGTASSAGIEALYDTGPLTELEAALLQHRAALLAIVGVLLLVSILSKHLRPAAIAAALASNASFILFTLVHSASFDSLALVAATDVVLSVLLAFALFFSRK